MKIKKNTFLFVAAVCCIQTALAQTDTIRIMAYNVLNYGEYPLCQGANGIYHNYLDTIVRYANPDIIGLEKMGSIQTSPTDHNYTAVAGFQDSILQYALNPAFPGRYNYCPFTNNAASGTECLVFYDQNKLGFAALTCTYTNTEDFNTYKLYYKDPNLATTHDTTFLYVTDNHDISGSSSAADRGAQIAGEMAQIQTHFTHLGNMINMGDFNLRNTSEPVYQTLTNPADTNFRYYDAPFYPDGIFTYPADWDNSPGTYTAYLTTSTRQSGSIPNSCGTSGGAKDWFDHIFISPWIVNDANYIAYIPHSFRVIGNDGHRLSISANSAPTNTSAPAAVINAIFQMSNKYPVMLDLLATHNTTGVSPADPEIMPSLVPGEALAHEAITLINPADDAIKLNCTIGLVGHTVDLECIDMLGRMMQRQPIAINATSVAIPCNINAGMYFVRIIGDNKVLCQAMLIKK